MTGRVLLLSPSRGLGGGIELYIAGTPVLAPAHCRAQDAFVAGLTGIADTLEELLKDPDQVAWTGQHAARRAQDVSAPERYRQLVVRRLP